MLKRLTLTLTLLLLPSLAAAACPPRLDGTWTFVLSGSDASRIHGTLAFTPGEQRLGIHAVALGTAVDLGGEYTVIGNAEPCGFLLHVVRPGQTPMAFWGTLYPDIDVVRFAAGGVAYR